jgi:hypothetical protein
MLKEITTSMIMTTFLLQCKFLRELRQLHLILMMDLDDLLVRRNLSIGLSLVLRISVTLVPIMFGSQVRMVVWRDLISGLFDGV